MEVVEDININYSFDTNEMNIDDRNEVNTNASPGESCPTVNGRNLVNYGGKRQTCTIIVYDHRIRCFTIYYDDRKLLP